MLQPQPSIGYLSTITIPLVTKVGRCQPPVAPYHGHQSLSNKRVQTLLQVMTSLAKASIDVALAGESQVRMGARDFRLVSCIDDAINACRG